VDGFLFRDEESVSEAIRSIVARERVIEQT
jgi:hypothetical protein